MTSMCLSKYNCVVFRLPCVAELKVTIFFNKKKNVRYNGTNVLNVLYHDGQTCLQKIYIIQAVIVITNH